jgi:hypothetical protein
MVAEPAVTSPVTLNAPVAVGEDESRLLMLIFFVVPLPAIVVSLTSTIGITSLAGSAAVNAVSAVIFVSAILFYG